MSALIPQKKLMATERYHDRALNMLNAMFQRSRENLLSRYGNDTNTSVRRHDWRMAMKEKFGIYYDLARDIEENLSDLGKVELLATFVKPVAEKQPEPVQAKELSISDKFFCLPCKKLKGVPVQQYTLHEKVNFTVPGGGGHPAFNQVGSIQLIQGSLLFIAGATREYRISRDEVTPVWAPSPLMYKTMGKCWCDIDPEYLPGGAA